MPIFKVRGLGSKGVIKDTPSFDLPPEAWSHANNMRFVAQRAEKVGGYFPVLEAEMPGTPLSILYRNNTQSQIYGTKDSLYMVNGRRHYNVSRYDNEGENQSESNLYKYRAGPESTWYYTTLSNAVIMNTPYDDPQGMIPGEDRFKTLPNWGRPKSNKPDEVVDWKCGRIRSYKNYLIALSMVEGGVAMPQRVRWSNVSYVNDLPPDWYEDSDTSDGGFNDLSDANGRIIDGVPLRDSFVIYTDKETYLMEYIGGILLFQFKKLFSDSGILAPECAVEFEQKHFVISHDDIFIHNGSSKQPVASARVKKYLIDEISSVNPLATKVFAYTPAKEIWITYVGPGQTSESASTWSEFEKLENRAALSGDILWTCNKCAVWNWEWDTWSFRDIPPSFDINMAPPPDLDSPEWDDFTNPEDFWESEENIEVQWSPLGKDFVKNVPYVASADGCLYTLDTGDVYIRYRKEDQTYTIHPIVGELVRNYLDMDELVENTRMHKFIKTITPQFSGVGEVWCYVGGSVNPTDSPTWDSSCLFNLETDVKIDTFSNNRYPAIRFVNYSVGAWTFQGYDIDFVVEGNR